MSETTIVTAFFDIGRGNLSKKDHPSYLVRSNKTYLQYFANLAVLENEMVVFTSKEFEADILRLRGGRKTKVVVFDFHRKLPYIRKRVGQIQQSESFRRRVDAQQLKNIEYWLPDYVMINNMKAFWVNEAVRRGLTSHGQLAWIDFGYVRDKTTLAGLTEWCPDFAADKVHLFSINNRELPRDFDDVEKLIFNNQVFIIGGGIVASAEKWREFGRLLFDCQKSLMRQNIVDDDQGLYALCLFRRPELFEVHYLGREQWFSLFKKHGRKTDLVRLSRDLDKPSASARLLGVLEKKPCKIFYRVFVPKPLRNRIRYAADLTQQQRMADGFEQLLAACRAGAWPPVEIAAKRDLGGRRVIWQYWGQGVAGDLPEVVRLSFASVERFKGGFEVIRLDDENISDYLDIPDFVWAKKRGNPQFTHAFFSDLLRIALLNAYGGVWLDATVFLSRELGAEIADSDLFLYTRSPQAENQAFWHRYNPLYFSWHRRHRVNMLSSFIVARPKQAVIAECLQLMLYFWRHQNSLPHYFCLQILFDVVREYAAPSCRPQTRDDTLPHLLVAAMRQDFDEARLAEILRQSGVHKLTYLAGLPSNPYYRRLLGLLER